MYTNLKERKSRAAKTKTHSLRIKNTHARTINDKIEVHLCRNHYKTYNKYTQCSCGDILVAHYQ